VPAVRAYWVLMMPAVTAAQQLPPRVTQPVAPGTDAGWGWLWFVLIVAAVILIVSALTTGSRSRPPPV